MSPLPILVFVSLSTVSAVSLNAAVAQIAPVSASTPALTIKANLDAYLGLMHEAASHDADMIVFPEFGLNGAGDVWTDHCKSPSDPQPWCSPMPVSVGDVPCGNAAVTAANPSLAQASCNSHNASVASSVNMCERGDDGNNWNTQVVFDSTGCVLAKYRKSHPYDEKCFQTPSPPDLVTFNLTVGATPVTFGVFTCKDILYKTPGPELAKMGIRNFVYSAAIPIVGADAVKLWSKHYDATLLSSDLQAHESGVFQRGSRLTSRPDTGTLLMMTTVDMS